MPQNTTNSETELARVEMSITVFVKCFRPALDEMMSLDPQDEESAEICI